MKRACILLVSLLAGASPSLVGAATYYVDKAATGADNGLSWGNAWRSFAAVNWGLISGGDTVCISGGTASKTYLETLTIGASGSAGSPILICGSSDPGHDGTVIIDGQNVRENAVLVDGRQHVVVKALKLANAIGSGAIRIKESSNVTAENLNITVRGHGGVHIQGSSHCIVRGNIIRTPAANYDVQTDGIYAQYNEGNIYELNDVVISNTNASQHCDGIQLYRESNAVVRSNYFEQDNTKTANAQGIYCTVGSGSIRIYNNVVVCPSTLANLIGGYNLSGGTAHFLIANNTVLGKSSNMISLDDTSPTVKNNIIRKTVSGSAMRFQKTLSSFASIDYNIVFVPGGGDVVYYDPLADAKTWAEWKAMGAESHGQLVDPRINPDGTLMGGSPAIDRGADLSSLFSFDKAGTARPAGQWDVGAYEYGSAPPARIQAPENLRIKP